MSLSPLVSPFEFTTSNLLFPMRESPLSSIPFHLDSAAVTRYIADRFPFHIAVHEIKTGADAPPAYTQLHVHEDEDEVNIILSNDHLLYRIELDEEEHYIESNTCIYIPRRLPHSANVIRGSGYFITIRFS